MSEQTRAVIIGAGMGGLASALLLAHRGLDVTVLEMGQQPGGKAKNIEKQVGLAFDQ